jgi:acetyltransferase
MALAKRMVKGTKISTLLKGYRKMPRVDMDALYFLLVRFGYLLMDFPEIEECDLNPYVLDEEGGVVIDARMMIKPLATPQALPCDHLVISPYPSQFIRESTLSDGTPVILRPIRPEDEPLEADLLNRLSKETIYFRFFGFAPHGDHDFLSRFTHIDYDREMAIVAEIKLDDQPALIGVVRIVGDHEKQAAEFAIVVADDWHRKGLGRQLTDFIIEIATTLGYKEIFASFMKSNHAMYHLFQKKQFVISDDDVNTNKAVLKLNQ